MLSGIRSEWKGKTIEIYEVVPEEPTVKIDSLGEVAKVSRVSFLVEKMIEEHGEQFGEVTVPLIGNLRNYSRFMDDQEVDSPFGNVDPSEVRERSGILLVGLPREKLEKPLIILTMSLEMP